MRFCPSSKIIYRTMEKLRGKNKKKQNHKVGDNKKVKGTVVVLKKNVLDFKDVKASLLDRIHELLGKCVSLQLISSARPDPGHPKSLSLSLLCFVLLYECIN